MTNHFIRSSALYSIYWYLIFLTVGKKRGICKCGQCRCNRGYIGSNCGKIDCSLEIEKCLNKGVCVVVIQMYFTVNSNHAVTFYQQNWLKVYVYPLRLIKPIW